MAPSKGFFIGFVVWPESKSRVEVCDAIVSFASLMMCIRVLARYSDVPDYTGQVMEVDGC